MGKCWIGLTGVAVAVAVGGTAVGVSVGGTGVAEGAAVSVGGMLVGMLVAAVIGKPVVVQLASVRMMRLNKMGKDNFLIISFLLLPLNVDYRFSVP